MSMYALLFIGVVLVVAILKGLWKLVKFAVFAAVAVFALKMLGII